MPRWGLGPVFASEWLTTARRWQTYALRALFLLALLAAFAVVVGVAIFSCTLALTLSVWGRKPHEVLLATYFLEIGWLLAYPVSGTLAQIVGGPFAAGAWVEYTNPFRLALRPGNTAPADP